MIAAAAVSAGAALGVPAQAADAVKPAYTFGTLRTATPEQAKAKAAAWLTAVGRMDPAAFEAIWADESRSVFDRTVATLVLGSPEAAALLAEAAKPDAPPPTAVPPVIKDAKNDAYLRTNVATAYAKALAAKRVYEEALDALKVVPPEQAVDPSAYFFYRAVAEHALILREPATASITRLLDDVADAPDRYRMVATLMFFDIQNWPKDAKDLSNIGRLMDNSGRRLDLARGGPVTQDIQKKIVFRLDEAIKEMENQMKNGQGQNGGQCPSGGQKPGPGNTNPNNPAPDSVIMGGSGQGKVDEKKLRKLAEEWGKLPAAERAKAIQEITRDLPAKYKPMIEDYFKSLNRVNGLPNP
jgi:tetratricopeptide (TPR) repeat protein